MLLLDQLAGNNGKINNLCLVDISTVTCIIHRPYTYSIRSMVLLYKYYCMHRPDVYDCMYFFKPINRFI